MMLQVFLGVDDDDIYSLRVIQRVAKRQGAAARTDMPGIIFLEIDGLAGPMLRRAMRDGNTPLMARWLADGSHDLIEWEPDLSSQTGASQAGILLGSNEDIPAFRWVEKETGRLMTCSAPDDCAEIERRHASGAGLLIDGGASRGNLLSGEADEVILTVSRMQADKKANPGYRAFLANGFNVTRELVLFCWEVGLEWSAAARQRRRDVIPRGHRGGPLPVPARCTVRRGPRPDRVRRPHRHDARPPRRVRDLLQLRRGRTPLGARAGRHAGGAAKARQAVRTNREGGALRPPAVQARGALRSRSDAGNDVQAAQRLRARRARAALTLAGRREGHERRRRARHRGRAGVQRSDRPHRRP